MDDAVVGEIELTADGFEPLDYDDATDDSLNATIATVVGKVCEPSAHKKAGGPRNDDVSNMGEIRIQDNKRRSNLLRSAKKHYESEVHDVCSDDDMLFELPEDSQTESNLRRYTDSGETAHQFEVLLLGDSVKTFDRRMNVIGFLIRAIQPKKPRKAKGNAF